MYKEIAFVVQLGRFPTHCQTYPKDQYRIYRKCLETHGLQYIYTLFSILVSS